MAATANNDVIEHHQIYRFGCSGYGFGCLDVRPARPRISRRMVVGDDDRARTKIERAMDDPSRTDEGGINVTVARQPIGKETVRPVQE